MPLIRPPAVFTLEEVQETARIILHTRPDPVPAWRLQREALRLPADDFELRAAREAVAHSKWVKQLRDAQLPDGSWGRFHSQDTKKKTVFRTSEEAIDRAFALGFWPDHPVLTQARIYIEKALTGRVNITDRDEKNEAWPLLIKFILAGRLAQIDPSNQALDPYWELLAEVTQQAFTSGGYRLEDEVQATHALQESTCRKASWKASMPCGSYPHETFQARSSTRWWSGSGISRMACVTCAHRYPNHSPG